MRISDWSSDVCSSDLERPGDGGDAADEREQHDDQAAHRLERRAPDRTRDPAEQRPRATGDEPGHGEDGHLVPPDAHAERGSGQLAVAQSGELATEPAAPDGYYPHVERAEVERSPQDRKHTSLNSSH